MRGIVYLWKLGDIFVFLHFFLEIKEPHSRRPGRLVRLFVCAKVGGNVARADKVGVHRTAFEKNKRRIMQSQEVCGICGKPVDKSLKFPHPLSACIDHILPIDKGGHPFLRVKRGLPRMTLAL